MLRQNDYILWKTNSSMASKVKPQTKRQQMLRAPIPFGASRERVLAQLRKRIVEAGKVGAKKPGRSFAMKGQRGAGNALPKMERISKIADGSGPNVEIATKLLQVFKAAREGTINPEADPFAGHQVLVDIANKLLKTEKMNLILRDYADVKLTPKQKTVLNRWYRLAK